VLLLICSVGAVTAQTTHPGTIAAIGTFNGLSNLGFGNYNGGAGVKFYFTKDLAAKTGVSYSRIDDNGSITRTYGVNGGLTYDILSTENTKGYFGGVLSYNHQVETDNLYGYAAVAGFEVFIIKNVSLGAETQLQYTTRNNFNSFVLQPPGGSLIATVILN